MNQLDLQCLQEVTQYVHCTLIKALNLNQLNLRPGPGCSSR